MKCRYCGRGELLNNTADGVVCDACEGHVLANEEVNKLEDHMNRHGVSAPVDKCVWVHDSLTLCGDISELFRGGVIYNLPVSWNGMRAGELVLQGCGKALKFCPFCGVGLNFP